MKTFGSMTYSHNWLF